MNLGHLNTTISEHYVKKNGNLSVKLHENVANILKTDLKDKVILELITELKPTIKANLKTELHDTVVNTLKNEMKDNIMNVLKAELKPKVTYLLKTELRQTVIDTIKSEFQEKIMNELKNELKPSVIAKLKEELQSKVTIELQNEFRDSIKMTLRDEMKENVINILKNKMRPTIINNLKLEFQEKVITDLKSELQETVITNLKSELQEKVIHDLKLEQKENVITYLKHQFKEPIIKTLKHELHDNVINTLKLELKEQVINHLKIELTETVSNELKNELSTTIINKLKTDLYSSVSQDLTNKYQQQTILEEFTNKKLKKIVNVYQLNYVNGKSQGLGDFLRGCFCFMQLSKLLNIDFDIDISNHPISKYIENANPVDGIEHDYLEIYTETNTGEEINHQNYEKTYKNNVNKYFLNKTILWLNAKNCEVYGFFSNAFPSYKHHTQTGKDFINSKFMPNEYMKSYIEQTLNQLTLTKNQYQVIHIRSGDEYAFTRNKQINMQFINKIKSILNNLIKTDCKYLIISDSNIIKNQLQSYPNFYTVIREIEHLGGEAIKNADGNGVINTLLDFYLMSYSNNIVSLSVYEHVSGFSKYCSILHNIPFQFIKISH